MFKPFILAGVILFCVPTIARAQSTGTVTADSAIRKQLQQEQLQHRTEQQKADAEFMKTLSGKTEAERLAAVKERARQKRAEDKTFRAKIHSEKSDYRKKAHDERMAYMKAKLDKDNKLSAAEKASLLAFMEEQYKSAADYDDKQFSSSQDFMDKLDDPSLSKEQRQALMKEQADKSRAAAKAHREELAQQNKTYREQQRASRQTDLKAKAAATAPAGIKIVQ
ncbi:MAG TPA: hypothetical protein PLL10_00260 [Elusimicrobiales bacterium]|nr:hypothetical protein [Elusimicrobiales bacterium]